ncbi:hypothetical protein [Cohnella mopanensis]|uniref:hypothetical protein n=1 Tax=Cohnella mopanensis TaxID=2911966 RepID=UPI001EF90A06|nr:hypothetical protein [Cohnella mopanensis]
MKRWLIWSGAVLTCCVLFVVFLYAYNVPGGIADWKYSKAIGLTETLSIPTGRTPEEAVQKFRNTPMQVLHRESVDGGVLFFLQRYEQKENSTNLQIEFVHKTWLGWKWVMGGGYGRSRSDSNEALIYMSIPRSKGIHGPFPIIFGQITNSDITNVNVSIGGDDAGKYYAKLIEYGGEQRLWYVVFPSSAEVPYEIEALNGEGSVIARKSLDDSHDFASVLMSK